MDFQVEISPIALRELAEITEYISVDGMYDAIGFGEKLLSTVASLHRFPNRHTRVTRKSSSGKSYRKVSVGSYLIYYHVNEQKRMVTVVHFWHGARQPPRL
jgi:plasmid stabilization system protein ParE